MPPTWPTPPNKKRRVSCGTHAHILLYKRPQAHISQQTAFTELKIRHTVCKQNTKRHEFARHVVVPRTRAVNRASSLWSRIPVSWEVRFPLISALRERIAEARQTVSGPVSVHWLTPLNAQGTSLHCGLSNQRQMQKWPATCFYRTVPENSDMDNLNSQLIRSPVETRQRSILCVNLPVWPKVQIIKDILCFFFFN